MIVNFDTITNMNSTKTVVSIESEATTEDPPAPDRTYWSLTTKAVINKEKCLQQKRIFIALRHPIHSLDSN